MRWIWLFWVLWAWVGAVQGQNLAPGEPQAFALAMDAPSEVRADLERHLALQRYRAVADLSDSELDRLMAQAIQDSRDLLATLGYFAPDITLERGTPLPGGTRTLTLRVLIRPMWTYENLRVDPAVLNTGASREWRGFCGSGSNSAFSHVGRAQAAIKSGAISPGRP